MRSTTLILAALAFAFFAAAPAQASLILVLDDTATAGFDSIVIDNSASGILSSGGSWTSNTGDINAAAGAVTFIGTVGSFDVNVSTGISKPVIGPRQLDLTSVNVSGKLAGQLVLWLIDTDYSAPGYAGPYAVRTSIGGTTGGTVRSQTGVGTANQEIGFLGPLNDVTFGPIAFSSDIYTNVAMAPGSTFSLLSLITITHTDAGQISSFDQLVNVPEPASLALLGFGALALVRRRRKTA